MNYYNIYNLVQIDGMPALGCIEFYYKSDLSPVQIARNMRRFYHLDHMEIIVVLDIYNNRLHTFDLKYEIKETPDHSTA